MNYHTSSMSITNIVKEIRMVYRKCELITNRMQRRDILRRVGTSLATVTLMNGTALAGASQTSEEPTPTTEQFTVLDRQCGTRTDDALIDYRSEQSAVHITGTITGRNTGATAVLDSVTYDSESGSLEVVIATRSETGSGYWLPCLYEIDYTAIIGLDDDSLETVSVIHRGIGEITQFETE
jgi:hypothetical protein